MVGYIIAGIIGAMFGGIVAVAIMACCVVGSRADDDRDKMVKNMCESGMDE